MTTGTNSRHLEGHLVEIPQVTTIDSRTTNRLLISRRESGKIVAFTYNGPTPDASVGHDVVLDFEPEIGRGENVDIRGRIWRMYDPVLNREYLSR